MTIVFVVSTPAGWNVGRCPAYAVEGGSWVAEGLDPSDALEVAAGYAEDAGGAVARRSARWRSAAPSPAQLALARDLGVPEADDSRVSRGDLSAAIDRAKASRVLRPMADWADALAAEGVTA